MRFRVRVSAIYGFFLISSLFSIFSSFLDIFAFLEEFWIFLEKKRVLWPFGGFLDGFMGF